MGVSPYQTVEEFKANEETKGKEETSNQGGWFTRDGTQALGFYTSVYSFAFVSCLYV